MKNFLWVLIVILSGCVFQEKTLKVTGYVEGNFQMLSSLESSRIEKIFVKKGDRVKKDQALVELNSTDLDIALEKARATFELSTLTKSRTLYLEKDGAVAKSEFDNAQTTYTTAKSDLDLLKWRKEQRTIRAPKDGFIQDVIRDIGETCSSDLPAIYFLPNDALKGRFFVGQDFISSIKIGQKVKGFLDEKSKPFMMTIDFISDRTEFTPPIIYTRDLRGSLVYMIEASLDQPFELLKAGQPLDVEIELLNDK